MNLRHYKLKQEEGQRNTRNFSFICGKAIEPRNIRHKLLAIYYTEFLERQLFQRKTRVIYKLDLGKKLTKFLKKMQYLLQNYVPTS